MTPVLVGAERSIKNATAGERKNKIAPDGEMGAIRWYEAF